MSIVLSRLTKIIEHIKYGNTQFALLEAEELKQFLSIPLKPQHDIAVDDEHFLAVNKLIQLKYGDSSPFCYGLALLLHASGKLEEAQRLFSLSCGDSTNGSQTGNEASERKRNDHP